MDTRVQLLEQLETLKRENPELEDILQKFQMDMEEYERTMLAILSAQTMTYPTAANAKTYACASLFEYERDLWGV